MRIGEEMITRRSRGLAAMAFLEALHRMHHLVAQNQQLPAERRGFDTAVADRGDGAADRVRELAQHAGDRRLRDRELLGGSRDAAETHARLEGHQLGKETVPEESSQPGARHRELLESSLAKVWLTNQLLKPVADRAGAVLAARTDDTTVKATPL